MEFPDWVQVKKIYCIKLRSFFTIWCFATSTGEVESVNIHNLASFTFKKLSYLMWVWVKITINAWKLSTGNESL